MWQQVGIGPFQHQHNNAPVHNGGGGIVWSVQRPDRNPIGHLWNGLETVACQTYAAEYHASAARFTTGGMVQNFCNRLPELTGKPTPKDNEHHSGGRRSDPVLPTAGKNQHLLSGHFWQPSVVVFKKLVITYVSDNSLFCL